MKNISKAPAVSPRRDVRQEVTDTIIRQLEAGTIPWRQPWKGGFDRLPALPQNFTTNRKYRGVNIILLWCAAIQNKYGSAEWASFKQWQEKKEVIRKGEKGSMIVYYDTIEKEQDGEIKKIPFIKTSVVFNRCQLASYAPPTVEEHPETVSLVERIEKVDAFLSNTQAVIEHRDYRAAYVPSKDIILMPHPEAFRDTETCTATEGYYSTLLHEMTHWTGNKKRLNRKGGKKFGDHQYAAEELIAELGAAFMCAEFDIGIADKGDHANYIASWLKVLKDNKEWIISAASEASKAVDYLQTLQPA